jgi:putative N-acetylmannosamine-6-phosphate epimerase
VSERDERDETDRHHDDAEDDPPFDIVQAVSDFVENVIDEGDTDTPDAPDNADD